MDTRIVQGPARRSSTECTYVARPPLTDCVRVPSIPRTAPAAPTIPGRCAHCPKARCPEDWCASARRSDRRRVGGSGLCAPRRGRARYSTARCRVPCQRADPWPPGPWAWSFPQQERPIPLDFRWTIAVHLQRVLQEPARVKEAQAAFECAWWASRKRSILEARDGMDVGQARSCSRIRKPRALRRSAVRSVPQRQLHKVSPCQPRPFARHWWCCAIP